VTGPRGRSLQARQAHPERGKVHAKERTQIVQQIVLDAEAGQLSAELTRRGVAAETRVHVVIDVLDADPLPMAAIAQAGKALDWLADEPDLYADADLFAHAG
jgi:hypothetical protein